MPRRSNKMRSSRRKSAEIGGRRRRGASRKVRGGYMCSDGGADGKCPMGTRAECDSSGKYIIRCTKG